MNEEEARETLKTMKENIDKKYLKTKNSLAIETVLNLLEKKDRQLEEKTNRIRNLEKECQKYFDNMMDIIQDNCKKDKIIDEMAYYLSDFDIDEMCSKCDRCIGNGCYADDDMEFKIKCIKQYFERKIEQ